MKTKPFLMGAEVEYSMSRPQRRGRRNLHPLLLEAIRADHRWLPDVQSPSGIYLDNGARYYLDSGNHNEFSSPELHAPRQVAVYDRAGEQILLRAVASLKSRKRINVCVTKNNVNFTVPDRAAWGQHEAYTCWMPLKRAATQLIPHLVSRLPYAGAGCLSGQRTGVGYELSQRARHMTRSTGQETMHDRAIFCTRAWKPSDSSEAGWTRTNLISKDSQRCSFGMYLTYGVTGILFMIINEGHTIGRDVQLKNPVEAMRVFSLDPWLKAAVPLSKGKEATAIDIQRTYLRDARPHVESGVFPDWTSEVLNHWSETLDQLESDPLRLAKRLDTYLKWTIFDRELSRASFAWNDLHRGLQVLDEMRRAAPEPVVRAILNQESMPLADEYQLLRQHVEKNACSVDLDLLRFAVRLQALELNYHELGGLFDQLSDSGHLDAVVVTPEEVEYAIHNPPPGGRAQARGESVAEFNGQPWLCDWQYLVNQDGQKWVDLRDPFSYQAKVKSTDDGPVPWNQSTPSQIRSFLARMAE